MFRSNKFNFLQKFLWVKEASAVECFLGFLGSKVLRLCCAPCWGDFGKLSARRNEFDFLQKSLRVKEEASSVKCFLGFLGSKVLRFCCAPCWGDLESFCSEATSSIFCRSLFGKRKTRPVKCLWVSWDPKCCASIVHPDGVIWKAYVPKQRVSDLLQDFLRIREKQVR